jgi:uncharacterized protein (TIGR03000 family)
MSIEKKKIAAAVLGLAALAGMASMAHAQMMRGGRTGGMMMGGVMGGMRGPFMVQPSPMVSPMMGTSGGMGTFNPSMALFQPRMFGSNMNRGGGLTNFGISGFNSFGNALAMPFRGGYGIGGYGMGGYGMGLGGYGMGGGYGMSGYGGYGAAGSGYAMSNSYGAGSYDYARGQQAELPHPAGDVPVAPADAAVIRLRVPDQFATVSFNGQSVSSIGTKRTFVSPNGGPGKNWTYEIRATWTAGNRQMTREKVVEVRAGQISTADLTQE